jgi:hypothetical protein
VYLDGKRIGDTPIVRLEVAAGRHRLRADSSGGGRTELTLTVEAGETVRRRLEGFE